MCENYQRKNQKLTDSKLQYSGYLMQRTDWLEKTLMLEKIKGGRRRGQQRMRWLDDTWTQWTWVWETLGDGELPGGSGSEESACKVGDLGSIPGWEDPLEEGMGFSCLENPHGQRTLRDTVHGFRERQTRLSNSALSTGDGEGQGSLACCSPRGHKELDTTERLNKKEKNTEVIICASQDFDPSTECLGSSTHIPWRKKWQPTPVFSPGKSHEQRSLAG